MQLTKQMVVVAQQILNNRCNAGLKADGHIGIKTVSATQSISEIASTWNDNRKIIATIQFGANMNGIPVGAIDGLWGPQTDYAFNQLIGSNKLWRADDPGQLNDTKSDGWPRQVQYELIEFYGDVGTNQTRATSPYPLKIAWDVSKTITSFSCHEKVKDSIERAMLKVFNHYGQAEIERLGLDMFGGCLNVRPMRGGTKYSTHAWGVAIDWDPSRNQLRWGADKAYFAKPEYEFWWKCWEDEGAISLGRARNFDWMHLQFARI
jgi:hypothetical protein